VSYGYGTHSYLNSTEHRENKRQMAQATADYQAKPHVEIELDRSWLMCACDLRPHKHPAHRLTDFKEIRIWFARDGEAKARWLNHIKCRRESDDSVG